MMISKALHFNTFGGNPMACRVGMEVLDVIDDEKLQENSHVVGTYFLERMRKLMDKYDFIGDVRGMVSLLEDAYLERNLGPYAWL